MARRKGPGVTWLCLTVVKGKIFICAVEDTQTYNMLLNLIRTYNWREWVRKFPEIVDSPLAVVIVQVHLL